MKHRAYDVIVVGAGHAGVEAALAAGRMGVRTALITLREADVGVMSCNPAIGGLGKGHLVREIDALDGVMGHAADKAGIQFRLLNRRKGPAVQGPRAQADRALYRKAIQEAIAAVENVDLVLGEVSALSFTDLRVTGVELADGSLVPSQKVILTTGTFLRGVIHIGNVKKSGGRLGDAPAIKLAKQMDEFGFEFGRLKTGTPPRLDGTTIDWGKLETQQGDADPVMFSFLANGVVADQISCGITHTNSLTHEIISKNLDRSAMYGGQIDGVGPRYCPSIEDKVVRFADKSSHQIFLEPESLSDNMIYPNGISTSLPVDVQKSYVSSIVGLENTKILQPGYAIEYDYVDPRALRQTMEVRERPGLFFAGQINGTTGYEEAAAQGMVAGLNAAAQCKDEPDVLFDRKTSYIGVLVDDLVTQGVTEPYRMFTSRAEYRLSLRADNADQRLTQFGISVGCVGRVRTAKFQDKAELLEKCVSDLMDSAWTPKQLNSYGITVKEDGKKRNGMEVLAFPEVSFPDLFVLDAKFLETPAYIQSQVEKDALYANYIQRQERDVSVLKRDESILIPESFSYLEISGLSNELKEKLNRVRPVSVGQAGRIDGMTPAALTLLLAHVRISEKRRSA